VTALWGLRAESIPNSPNDSVAAHSVCFFPKSCVQAWTGVLHFASQTQRVLRRSCAERNKALVAPWSANGRGKTARWGEIAHLEIWHVNGAIRPREMFQPYWGLSGRSCREAGGKQKGHPERDDPESIPGSLAQLLDRPHVIHGRQGLRRRQLLALLQFFLRHFSSSGWIWISLNCFVYNLAFLWPNAGWCFL